MKLIWFSRHLPTKRQRTELKALFGADVRIFKDRKPFDGADEIVARFKRSGADEMVVVAPLSVVKQLVDRGIHPIWARMQTCPRSHPQAEVRIKNRHYRFVKFSRINGISLDLGDVLPNAPQPKE